MLSKLSTLPPLPSAAVGHEKDLGLVICFFALMLWVQGPRFWADGLWGCGIGIDESGFGD